MPDDRLIHRCAGHGERANQLTHLEYRVWTQYLLSSDDFGVMRRTALTIQADNDALADEKPAVIERALLRLVSVALVVEFEHQRRYYICQLDWQARQKIDYPRGTSNPKPPDSIIAKCDELTRRLFDGHPGGKGRKKGDALPSGSTSVQRTESEPKENILDYASAGAREEANAKANANANGSDERLTANVSEGERERKPRPTSLVQPPNAYAFWSSRGMHVPWKLHEETALALGSDDAARAFYKAVDDEWKPGGPKALQPVGDSTWKFWQARRSERFGTTAATPAEAKSAASVAAAQRFIARGQA